MGTPSRILSDFRSYKFGVSSLARFDRWNVCALLLLFLLTGLGQAQDPRAQEPATQDPAVPEQGPPAAKAQEEPVGAVVEPQGVKEAKASPKYDVNHIGERGIGKGVNFYSLERERRVGEVLARGIDLHTKFITDTEVTDYVNRLGQKIVRNSDCLVPFTIKVIDSQDIRAFSLPGGYLYVDSGLILASDTEAELAGVMAHEIAHVAARHATREATRKFFWDVASSLSYLGGPIGIGLQNIGGIGAPLTFKKFSRDAETEADLLGIEYEYAAGYDPEAFVTALEKLHVIEARMHKVKSKVPIYNFFARMPFHGQIARGFAAYPMTEERIQRVQAEIAGLLPGKQEYVSDTSEFQEVKYRLGVSQAPVLRRHKRGEGNANGPVLRRNRPD
jgi:predicted Zn-dependent protease